MGTVSDMARRANKREETEERLTLIKAAADYIYRQGFAITSQCVENLLKVASWVPTTVRHAESIAISLTIGFYRMHSLGCSSIMARVPSSSFSWTCCTSLSSAFGKPCLRISSGSYGR